MRLPHSAREIMRALDHGESLTVTHNGVPVAVLAPIGQHRRVSSTNLLEAFGHTPEVDPDRLRADLDAVADQSADPRA